MPIDKKREKIQHLERPGRTLNIDKDKERQETTVEGHKYDPACYQTTHVL